MPLFIQPNNNSSIRQLRRQLRSSRRALSQQQQRHHSQKVMRLLCSYGLLTRYQRIALYLCVDGEVNLAPVIRLIQHSQQACYLPVLRKLSVHARTLWFFHYRPNEPLYSNCFGIPEPRLATHQATPPWALDLILLPLVGFDPAGHRLGMGGGFYDRTLAYLRHRQHWHRPRLVGIAHECQKVSQLLPQPWDIALDAIITESQIYSAPPA